jgi:hypothetical protein
MKKFINDNLIIRYKHNYGLNSVKLRKIWFEKNGFLQQYNKILSITNFLEENVTISERIYCILNDISEKKKCPYCNDKLIKYSNFGVGYKRHCGTRKCSYLDKSIYRDENGLTSNEKSGIGLRKSFLEIQKNGKTRGKNVAEKAAETKRNNIKRGKNSFQIAAEKAAETKYNIIRNGLNIHQIAALKAAKTMEKINSKTGKSIKEERIENTNKTKCIIGEDGFDSYERAFLNGAGRNSSIKYYNKDLYYQGTYEKDFLDKLTNWNLINSIERGPRFNYLYENKNRQYRSDYYYNNIVFEIKSEWTYGKYDKEKRTKNHLKFRSVLENNLRLIVILDKTHFIEVTEKNINKNLYEEELMSIELLKNQL